MGDVFFLFFLYRLLPSADDRRIPTTHGYRNPTCSGPSFLPESCTDTSVFP